jgi:hypothetical protein
MGWKAGKCEIASYERPESRGGGEMGRMGGAVRRARATSWPPEVSSGARNVFISHRTLKELKAVGLPMDRIVMEIRSRKGIGFYIMARSLDYPVVHGETLSEATAALVNQIDPELKFVNGEQGKRVA